MASNECGRQGTVQVHDSLRCCTLTCLKKGPSEVVPSTLRIKKKSSATKYFALHFAVPKMAPQGLTREPVALAVRGHRS